MLRVYATAASLNRRGECGLIEVGSNAVRLEYAGAVLSLKINESDGAGSWTLDHAGRPQVHGSFQLSENGTLASDAWPGQILEVDQAAIEWVQQLAHEAARQNACCERTR
jgi:hypothetical protein